MDVSIGMRRYGLFSNHASELEPVRQSGSGPAGPDKTGRKVKPGRTRPDFCQFVIVNLVLVFKSFLQRKKLLFASFQLKHYLKCCWHFKIKDKRHDENIRTDSCVDTALIVLLLVRKKQLFWIKNLSNYLFFSSSKCLVKIGLFSCIFCSI